MAAGFLFDKKSRLCFPILGKSMGFRSKLGWAVAAVLAAALIYRTDDKPPPSISITPQSAVEAARPATQPHANPIAIKPVAKSSPPRPLVDVDVAKPKTPAPSIEAWEVFTTAKVRVRSGPNTKSTALRTIEKGTRLVSRSQKDGWHQVSYENTEGWVRSDYLADRAPEIVPAPDPPPAAIISKPQRRAAEPVRVARTGEAIRAPVTGSCDCPYDRMRNGRSCGGRSAWSKPGGRQPVCFVGE